MASILDHFNHFTHSEMGVIAGLDWDNDTPQHLKSLTLGNVLRTNGGVEAESTVRKLLLEILVQVDGG